MCLHFYHYAPIVVWCGDHQNFNTVVCESGSVFIKGKINNYSLNTLQSIELNYSVNGGAAVTQTISGLSVAPFSEYSFHTSNRVDPGIERNIRSNSMAGNAEWKCGSERGEWYNEKDNCCRRCDSEYYWWLFIRNSFFHNNCGIRGSGGSATRSGFSSNSVQ